MVSLSRFAPTVSSLLALCLCLVAGTSVGCKEAYDWERDDFERGTLGEELHKIWKKDAERAPENAASRVELLERERGDFVEAIDTLAPPSELDHVDRLLRKSDEPIQTGLFPDLTRKFHVALTEASRNEALLEELGRSHALASDAFLAREARPDLRRFFLDQPEARSTFLTLSSALLEVDGYAADGGEAPEESRAFLDLQRGLADALRTADGPSPSSTALVLRDILLREDGRFHSERDEPLPAVRYDERGYPRVVDETPNDDQRFAPLFPFADEDGDGLADLDADGRFILQKQRNHHVAPFASDETTDPFGRDEYGRAESGDGRVFEYVDLTKTGLHFLLRRAGRLHEEETIWNLLEGLPAALGERTTREDDDGTYRGYDPDQPLVDAARSALAALDFKTLPETLRSLAHFLDGHQAELADLLHALSEAKSELDNYPEAQLTDDSTIGYDLLPVLEEIAADPLLWSDVMDALREPVVAETGRAMETLLRFRDRDTVPPEEGRYDSCFQECRKEFEGKATPKHPNGIGMLGRFECIRECPRDELFEKATDSNEPEAPDNRSNHQQLFHLLRDTAGHPYRMSIAEAEIAGFDVDNLPPIIELPGAAEQFTSSIAGNLEIKKYVSKEFTEHEVFGEIIDLLGIEDGDVANLLSTLSGLFGAHLDAEPTPDQITRLFNQPDLKFEASGVKIDVDDPVCKDGYVMANHHADKLFAAEASGLIDAIQPIAKAFSDHDREDLFTELFVIIHEHYSGSETLYETKDGSTSPMKGANLVSYEPALLKIARSGDLFRTLHELGVAIDRTKPTTGEQFDERLRQLVYNAVRSDRSEASGAQSTELELPDGDTVGEPSSLHLLFDALGRLVDRLDEEPERKEKLEDAARALNDGLLQTTEGREEEPEFASPGTVALLSLGARQLAESASRWRAEGRLTETLREDWPADLEELLSSRTFAAVLDLGEHLTAKPETKSAADRAATDLLASQEGRDELAATTYQLLLTSVRVESAAPARHSAELIDPDRTWKAPSGVDWSIDRSELPLVSHLLTFAIQVVEEDERGTGFEMLRRGVEPLENGETPIDIVSGVIADYYRNNPASTKPYAPEDYRRVFHEFAAWLGDDIHGLEQLYDFLQRRDENR